MVVANMNRPVIIVTLVLVATFSCYGISPEMRAAVDECKAQHNIESGQIKDAIDNKKLPDTENGQCFMSCVMEKLGVLKDGKVDVERSLELNKIKFKDPENLEKANEIVNRCASVEAPDSKPCSLATELARCAIKNALELKLEVPKEAYT